MGGGGGVYKIISEQLNGGYKNQIEKNIVCNKIILHKLIRHFFLKMRQLCIKIEIMKKPSHVQACLKTNNVSKMMSILGPYHRY